MKLKIFSIIAIMAFAFSLFFTASPPVAAETGKSFNQTFDGVGSAVAIETAQIAQADFDVVDVLIQEVRAINNPATSANFSGDIPIIALNSRKNIREILSENYREFYKTKDLVPITRKTKFSNQTDFGGGGFSGINVDIFARAKV